MDNHDLLSVSLAELSKRTEIDAPRWSRYFSGKVSPTARTLSRIAKGLEITPSQALELIESRKNQKLVS